jgi:hypothetical protein
MFTQVAAGWFYGLVETQFQLIHDSCSNSSMTPAGSDIGEYYQML